LHVMPEKAKPDNPFLAHSDAAAAVVFETRVSPVKTSLQHGFASIVKRSLFNAASCGRTVFKAAHGHEFLVKTG
jgi:hypothetical protein